MATAASSSRQAGNGQGQGDGRARRGGVARNGDAVAVAAIPPLSLLLLLW